MHYMLNFEMILFICLCSSLKRTKGNVCLFSGHCTIRQTKLKVVLSSNLPLNEYKKIITFFSGCIETTSLWDLCVYVEYLLYMVGMFTSYSLFEKWIQVGTILIPKDQRKKKRKKESSFSEGRFCYPCFT